MRRFIKCFMRPLIFISNDVSANYRRALYENGFEAADDRPDEADGLLLTGGGDVSPCLYGRKTGPSRDVDLKLDCYELYLINKFMLNDKPILGICRGLQVLNVFFGGTLVRHFDGHYSDRDTLVRCTFYGNLLDVYGASGQVLCRHHQKVDRLGKGLQLLAVSDDLCIEAFSLKKMLAVQFHPERMTTASGVAGDKIFSLFRRRFG